MPASPPESPFGVYVHWPFCLSKCPYCDFNSHVAEAIDQKSWARALLTEFEHFAGEAGERTVGSLFFGGGTPSLMDPDTIARLIEAVKSRFTPAPDFEITLEANPGTVDADRFAALRQAGIERLSLGLQALDDPSLRFLGRRHDVASALKAVGLARSIFPRMSFDLIYARPGQTAALWEAELDRAIEFAADHLSLYQLTIEEGTAFHPAYLRGDFVLPDEDEAARLFAVTQERTAAAGLFAYEISNHARPGAECRHNLLYWRGGDYLGIGPGAHGRLTDRSGTTRALRQHRAPEVWRGLVETHGHGTQEGVVLSAEERRIERVMMGLRLTEGIDLADFAARTGMALTEALDRSGLDMMLAEGFLTLSEDRLAATPKGRLLLNAVLARLI